MYLYKYLLNVVRIFTGYWFTYPIDIYETSNCRHLDISASLITVFRIFMDIFSAYEGYVVDI